MSELVPEVLVEKTDGVAIITLNRPDRLNALVSTIMAQLREAVIDVAEDSSIGCVVLTGAGRGFCAGGDLKDGGRDRFETTPEKGSRIEQASAQLRRFVESSRLLHDMPKPTIAMVNGPVAGAGVGLAGACDLRFAGESASFVTSFDRIGASGDFGSSYFWTKILGTGVARELFFLSEKLSAQEAFAKGIYTKLFPDAELRAATLAVAQKLANGPRIGWRYMKANLNKAETAAFGDALEHEVLNMTLSTAATGAIWKAAQKAKEET